MKRERRKMEREGIDRSLCMSKQTARGGWILSEKREIDNESIDRSPCISNQN